MKSFVAALEKRDELLRLSDLVVDDRLGEQCLCPLGHQLERAVELDLHSENFEWGLLPLLGESEDDLLEPCQAQCLAQVCVPQDLRLEWNVRALNSVRVLRILYEQDDLLEKLDVLWKDVPPETSNRLLDLQAVLLLAAAVVEVVEHRRDEQVAHLPWGQLFLVEDTGLAAHVENVHEVSEVVIPRAQVSGLEEDDPEIGCQGALVEFPDIANDLRNTASDKCCRCHFFLLGEIARCVLSKRLT